MRTVRYIFLPIIGTFPGALFGAVPGALLYLYNYGSTGAVTSGWLFWGPVLIGAVCGFGFGIFRAWKWDRETVYGVSLPIHGSTDWYLNEIRKNTTRD